MSSRVRAFIGTLILGDLLCSAAPGTAAPGRFMTYPDIQGDTIVFTYEGDLWTVAPAGGVARRLTTHPGTEDFSRISPDGKLVAFSGQYDGAAIYTVPMTGGVPKRVTYIGTGARPVAWTPDGAKVVFRSGHENMFRPIFRLYSVSPAG